MKVYVLIKEVIIDGHQFIDSKVYSTKQTSIEELNETRSIWEKEVYNENPKNFNRYSSTEFYWLINQKDKKYFKLILQEREVI